MQYVGTTIRVVNFPLWSLVCEVEFYALLPLLGWGLARLTRGSSRRAVCMVILFGLGTWLLSVIAARQTPAVWDFSLPATLLYFVPGMLVATVEIALQRTANGVPHPRVGTVGLIIALACRGR